MNTGDATVLELATLASRVMLPTMLAHNPQEAVEFAIQLVDEAKAAIAAMPPVHDPAPTNP
jgi:hypothetical protein